MRTRGDTHAAINIGSIITFRAVHALFFCSFALWCRPFVVVIIVYEKGNASSSTSSSSSSKTTKKKKNIDGRNEDNKRHFRWTKPARRTGLFLFPFPFLLLLFKTISDRLGRRWYSGKHHNLSFRSDEHGAQKARVARDIARTVRTWEQVHDPEEVLLSRVWR